MQPQPIQVSSTILIIVISTHSTNSIQNNFIDSIPGTVESCLMKCINLEIAISPLPHYLSLVTFDHSRLTKVLEYGLYDVVKIAYSNLSTSSEYAFHTGKCIQSFGIYELNYLRD